MTGAHGEPGWRAAPIERLPKSTATSSKLITADRERSSAPWVSVLFTLTHPIASGTQLPTSLAKLSDLSPKSDH